MDAVRDLPQLAQGGKQAVGQQRQLTPDLARGPGVIFWIILAFSASATRRCWMPSCRSRSSRRRVSSAAATIRARDADSSARLWVFAMAVPSSSVNPARRSHA
jgi:hypothetical protein